MRTLSAPIKVSLDVTGRCNLSCAHCRGRYGGPLGPPMAFDAMAEANESAEGIEPADG